MPTYHLEIKQLVDYPRCRIYRDFIRTLTADRNLHSRRGSGLFYFTALCSYANFRPSCRRIEGTSYALTPGEWICRLSEITQWFRTKYQWQALAALEYLQKQQYITFSRHARGQLVKFHITDWELFNTAISCDGLCQKESGFFFIPIAKANELVKLGKCSEMDIVLDLWMQTVYNEDLVRGSELGPVVYYRNYTGDPFVSYNELAQRWGLSKSTAGRVLNQLAEQDYLTLIPCTGRRGTVIYLNHYLSTMFEISDVMIDKEEVAMTLHVNVKVSEEPAGGVSEEQIRVSDLIPSVPKSHTLQIVRKAAQTLAVFGLTCCECPHALYKLFLFPDCMGEPTANLQIDCGRGGKVSYCFELRAVRQDGGDTA